MARAAGGSSGQDSIGQVENAHLLPCEQNGPHGEYVGGVYGADAVPVDLARRRTDSTDPAVHAPSLSAPALHRTVGGFEQGGYGAYLDEAVFGGFVFAGWGHVLTESLGTAWAASSVPPEMPVLYMPWGRVWLPTLRPTIDLLKAAWEGRNIVVLHTETMVGRLHVPQNHMRLDLIMDHHASIDSAMSVVYERIAADLIPEGSAIPSNVLVLRRGATHRRRWPEEEEFYALCEQEGWQVYDPAEHSLADQALACRSARVVIGFSGSQLHNSVFASSETQVIEVLDERDQQRRAVGCRLLQDAVAGLREQSHSVVLSMADVGVPRSVNDVFSEARDRVLSVVGTEE